MINLDNQLARRILGKVEINTILKRMSGKPLSQTERNYLSRSIRPKLLAAKYLTEQDIFKKIQGYDRTLENKIIYNLARYGYALILPKRIPRQKHIDIENLICLIISRNPKARFIEAVPTLILKNKIDKFRLANLAERFNFINQLGYLTEAAIIIAERLNIKHDFADLLEYLQKSKREEIAFLGMQKDKLYTDFLKKSSPERIKKWNLLGRFFDEEFTKNAETYIE